MPRASCSARRSAAARRTSCSRSTSSSSCSSATSSGAASSTVRDSPFPLSPRSLVARLRGTPHDHHGTRPTGRYLEWSPSNCAAWAAYADLEASLGEASRSRAIFELAVGQEQLDMPESLWKAYLDFEIGASEWDKARAGRRRARVRRPWTAAPHTPLPPTGARALPPPARAHAPRQGVALLRDDGGRGGRRGRGRGGARARGRRVRRGGGVVPRVRAEGRESARPRGARDCPRWPEMARDPPSARRRARSRDHSGGGPPN